MTAEEARMLFKYDPLTGNLIWAVTAGNGKCKPGMKAGWDRGNGNLRVNFDRETLEVTAVIWLIVHGRMPIGRIDHKNLNKSDNRLDNLRESTASQNGANRNVDRRNIFGLKGVSFDKERNLWRATITQNYKTITIGRYKSPEEAYEAYTNKAKELFGEFYRP